jgi:Fic family protein
MSENQPAEPSERLEQLETQLIRIERLLAIGFAEQLAARREEAGLGGQVSVAILERSATWMPAGPLKAAVEAATKQSSMTVKRRLKDLLEAGALEKSGKGSSTAYRSTGLLG